MWKSLLFRELVIALGIGLANPAGAEASEVPPVARAGVLDLRAWNFERDGIADLRGEWEICWDALLTPDEGNCPSGWSPVPVPRLWSEPDIDGAPANGRGVATYRLRVLLADDAPALSLRSGAPFTAFRIWIDGVPRGGSGRVSRSAAESVARAHNRVFVLGERDGPIELLVQNSNHEFRGGGLRRPWGLGTPDQIRNWLARALLSYGAFGAISVLVGLLYLVQFALRREETVRGYFGMAAVTIGCRVVVSTGTDLSQLLIPGMSFEAVVRTEYLTTALMIVAGSGYFSSKLRDVIPIWWVRVIQLGGGGIGAVAVLAPFSWTLASLRVTEVFALLSLFTGLIGYAIAFRRGKPYVGLNLAAMCLFGAAVVHDVVRVETGFGAPIELFSFFMVIWLFTEAWAMLRSYNDSFRTIETLSQDLLESNRELRETNAAVTRFVPYEFLERLDKRSLSEVKLGEHVEADMNVMFCDIRAFTGLVEGMDSEEAFAFINRFLQRMEPVIHAHGGFVNQYLGDGIMALFPAEGDAAIRAGIEMTEALRSMNREQGDGNLTKEVQMGIGLNAGSLMLGTIGGTERLSGGVIGDAVNIASRVEALTKIYGTPFVTTGETVASLAERRDFELREIDRVTVRGRQDAISVYEVIDALDEESRSNRIANRDHFDPALRLYLEGQWALALPGFEECCVRDPLDRAAELLAERCRQRLEAETRSSPTPGAGAGAE